MRLFEQQAVKNRHHMPVYSQVSQGHLGMVLFYLALFQLLLTKRQAPSFFLKRKTNPRPPYFFKKINYLDLSDF